MLSDIITVVLSSGGQCRSPCLSTARTRNFLFSSNHVKRGARLLGGRSSCLPEGTSAQSPPQRQVGGQVSFGVHTLPFPADRTDCARAEAHPTSAWRWTARLLGQPGWAQLEELPWILCPRAASTTRETAALEGGPHPSS